MGGGVVEGFHGKPDAGGNGTTEEASLIPDDGDGGGGAEVRDDGGWAIDSLGAGAARHSVCSHLGGILVVHGQASLDTRADDQGFLTNHVS